MGHGDLVTPLSGLNLIGLDALSRRGLHKVVTEKLTAFIIFTLISIWVGKQVEAFSLIFSFRAPVVKSNCL